MRVLLDARRVRAIRGLWTVTRQAHFGGRSHEIRIVAGAVDVVAAGAGYAVRVHHALREVVVRRGPAVCVFVERTADAQELSPGGG